jgi:hypothetical protein
MSRHRRCLFVLCLSVLFVPCSFAAVAGAPLVSGEPIRVGVHDGLGPLAAAKLNNVPLGATHVFGKKGADLFVRDASRFYPGVALFPWHEYNVAGTPVFDAPIAVSTPDSMIFSNPATVFEYAHQTHALSLSEGALVHLIFDLDAYTFKELERTPLPTLPSAPTAIAWLPDAAGPGFQLLMGIPGPREGAAAFNDKGSRDPLYVPFDGAGVWRGGFNYGALYTAHVPGLLRGPIEKARPATLATHDVRAGYHSLTAVDFGPGRARDLIGGSRFGLLYYYHQSPAADGAFDAFQNPASPDGEMLLHPTIGPRPVSYPNVSGQRSGLIVGGEGALYYYRFLNRFTAAGQPIYAPPTPALQEGADLFAGTLPVVNVVDWDGDGRLDIVSGNSEGLVLFFQNKGSNEAPAFAVGRPLEAGGRVIHVQAGYSNSLQGPDESRWGYTSPAVTDWNGDGLPDLILSDATAQHRVFLNEGSRRKPRLGFDRPLRLDGLELHGTWRVKPGVCKLGARTAYVCLDDDDEFHLYWKLDTCDLADGGKLKLESGQVIGANYLKAGGTGRLKFVLNDWDGDGKTDLLIGTPRHASIPDPKQGLPQALGKPGAAVIFMRNVGSDSAPVYAPPQVLAFQGKPIFFEQHECSVAVAPFGKGPQPGLIVGIETGRIIYFAREDISFVTPNVH